MTENSAPVILAVDDEESILELLEMGLGRENYQVITASSGTEALEKFRNFPPDLVILDWMLPGLDGLEVCKRIRTTSSVPIIMLTAKQELEDKVAGFETGADDYVPKPFKFKELLMRVKALLRRSGNTAGGSVLSCGDIVVNVSEHRAFFKKQELELTAKEFEILELFARNPRQVMSKDQILEKLWGWDYPGGANVVEVHVSALRNKLGDSGRNLIRTVRGAGYSLNA
ncbi:MAG: response regulator transcription factor [bacterium]|nr:response regulator transcription factor [bacterium]